MEENKMKPSQDITSHDVTTTMTQIVQWVQDLRDLHARIAPRFARPEPRRRALAYLQGIMSDISRKNGWQLAEHAREATPYGMQRLLSAAVWDDALVREDLRDYVCQHLGTTAAILVIDETSCPKSGDKSAGVQVQYCGTTGQIENCQVAVFVDYVTAHGHTLLDCELYLPKEWIDDPDRCREAGIPETTGFQTKCELARQMLERIWKAQIALSWVVADTVYGNNLDLRLWLEAHGYWYVLAVAYQEPVGIRTSDGRRRLVEVRQVEALLLQVQDWQRLSMGDGTTGPRLFDWACVPILHRWEDDGCHWLLIRRCINDPTRKAYYFVLGPRGTTLQQMVKAIGARWCIEDDFETSKALGLAQYEVRCFIGWYRHITLVMLAHAFLAVICAKAKQVSLVKDDSVPPPSPISDRDTSPASCLPSPLMPVPKPFPSLSAPQATLLPFPQAVSSPPVLKPAPLTIPEVGHLLGRLLWPISANVTFVLAWSKWRRCHRSMSSYYHTKRRLEAG
jgi:SRSO17 transposase